MSQLPTQSQLVEMARQLATPIDFAQLERDGILQRKGDWFQIKDAGRLPKHVSGQISAGKIDGTGNMLARLPSSWTRAEQLCRRFVERGFRDDLRARSVRSVLCIQGFVTMGVGLDRVHMLEGLSQGKGLSQIRAEGIDTRQIKKIKYKQKILKRETKAAGEGATVMSQEYEVRFHSRLSALKTLADVILNK